MIDTMTAGVPYELLTHEGVIRCCDYQLQSNDVEIRFDEAALSSTVTLSGEIIQRRSYTTKREFETEWFAELALVRADIEAGLGR